MVNLLALSKVLNKPLTFIDLETTGLLNIRDFAIIEIGVVRLFGDRVIEKSALINPGNIKIDSYIESITNISNEMVQGSDIFFKDLIPYFQKMSKTDILCGFNSKAFDSNAIKRLMAQYGVDISFNNQLDFRQIFIRLRNQLIGGISQKGRLEDACDFYNVEKPMGNAHRAGYDIALTALLAENIFNYHGLDILNVDVERFGDRAVVDKYKKILTK